MKSYQFIGQTKEKVIHSLEASDVDWRITRRDNVHHIVTRDVKPERWNLEFDDDILTKITFG